MKRASPPRSGRAANHRMNPTGLIGPRTSAAIRAFSEHCNQSSFTQSARRVMRVPLGRPPQSNNDLVNSGLSQCRIKQLGLNKESLQ
jgi:hypothetical protein